MAKTHAGAKPSPRQHPPVAAGVQEAQDLHEAVVALEDGTDASERVAKGRVDDVLAAATALDHASTKAVRVKKRAGAQIIHDLNNEAFTITTTADFVAIAIPEGQAHDDAVQIYEAGTRVAATAVRLRDHLEQVDTPA